MPSNILPFCRDRASVVKFWHTPLLSHPSGQHASAKTGKPEREGGQRRLRRLLPRLVGACGLKGLTRRARFRGQEKSGAAVGSHRPGNTGRRATPIENWHILGNPCYSRPETTAGTVKLDDAASSIAGTLCSWILDGAQVFPPTTEPVPGGRTPPDETQIHTEATVGTSCMRWTRRARRWTSQRLCTASLCRPWPWTRSACGVSVYDLMGQCVGGFWPQGPPPTPRSAITVPGRRQPGGVLSGAYRKCCLGGFLRALASDQTSPTRRVVYGLLWHRYLMFGHSIPQNDPTLHPYLQVYP